MKKKLAILASGNGTNAENLMRYFQESEKVEVSLVLSNNCKAFVLERAKYHYVQTVVFTKKELNDEASFLSLLEGYSIDYIILAGFLLLIPRYLTQNYADKIINIHPALLPKYGGKGMYGNHVHQRVIENKESESGITIHLVNEKFDEGKILFQAECKIDALDNSDTLAVKIHELEQKYFPLIVSDYILNTK